MLTWLRDYWRGYSDLDAYRAFNKITFSTEWSKPDGIIELTRREMAAARKQKLFIHRPSIVAMLKNGTVTKPTSYFGPEEPINLKLEPRSS